MRFFEFTNDKVICRLRWVTLAVMLTDAIVTLVGQPPNFWRDSKSVNEGEPIVRFFLSHGVIPYVVVGALYVAGVLFLASITPRRIGLTILFFFLLEHFWGATSWFMYHFGYNIRLQNIFELSIAVLIALAIGKGQKPA